jgi:CubicO group peptidase (beta-lactamase class C family)
MIEKILTYKLVSVSMIIGLLILNSCDKSIEPNAIAIESEILEELNNFNIPSVVACIVKGDEIVWEGAYGYADIEKSELANRQTLYNIESISKLLVATSVMQLWEQGLIELESDINQYLPYDIRNPNYPNIAITPHMLLNHTSSLAWPKAEDNLPDFEYFFSHSNVPLISEWIPDYILPEGDQYRTEVWKNFAPGEQELYSNIGTSLLALIVEYISGKDFRDYCREFILEPLEMDNSAFRIEYMNEEFLATPYYNSNYPIEQFVYRHYPAGNLKSNIEDFSHFIIAYLNYGVFKGKRILERETIEAMFEVQNPATGMANLWNHCLGDCIGKMGGGTGYSAWAEWHFESDTGIFIFSNKYNESVYPLGSIYELVRYQLTHY